MPAILPNPLDNPITVPDLDHMCISHTPLLTKISRFENVRFLSVPVWCHGKPSHGVSRINRPIEKEAEQYSHELF